MKKLVMLITVGFGLLFASCNSIDSYIRKIEKACKAGDLEKAEKLVDEFDKKYKEEDLTPEQMDKAIAATMECYKSEFALDDDDDDFDY